MTVQIKQNLCPKYLKFILLQYLNNREKSWNKHKKLNILRDHMSWLGLTTKHVFNHLLTRSSMEAMSFRH